MMTVTWPEWLTPEYSAIHTAIENEIKQALQHCYDSADASGLDWTTEGWISCSASNVMGMLERSGTGPPSVGKVERMPLPTGEEYTPEDDGLVECPTCEGVGFVEPAEVEGS